jgi:site-specific DNA-methyltransferase (adenine-specific)
MKLHNEDCIEQMQTMIDEGVQVDSIVTDPPYELGFMGKSWDSTGIAFQKETWQLAFQLLKPGGHLLAFGGSRTYHRMAVAIEDAGFEIRDQIMWLYGSGFPKSLNIGKAVDKKLGNKRTSLGKYKTPDGGQELSTYNNWKDDEGQERRTPEVTKGNSKWEGWGTALKPAHEPIVLARKPIEGTVAENVLKHGTGGINIDECRVETNEELGREQKDGPLPSKYGFNDNSMGNKFQEGSPLGRFPANVLHDGSDEVLEGFPTTSKSAGGGGMRGKGGQIYGEYKGKEYAKVIGFGDEGSAARFFYCAKVSRKERNRGLDNSADAHKSIGGNYSQSPVCKTCDKTLNGTNDHSSCSGKVYYRKMKSKISKNNHPTVKPIELMRYLCKLVTPKGGTILDPFMGSGSTGMAAKDEGFDFIGIEKEKEYYEIAEQRIKIVSPLLEFTHTHT